MLNKWVLYSLFACFIFVGQFLRSQNMLTGKPPIIQQQTIAQVDAASYYQKGPSMIYFWAEWCGVCRSMQHTINQLQTDYPHLTVAISSGTDEQIHNYLQQHRLNWPVANDAENTIAKDFGVSAVPALFILDRSGHIVFTTTGYSTELGLRIRLWLANFKVVSDLFG